LTPDAVLRRLFAVALGAVEPSARVAANLPAPHPQGRTVVVAFGKASQAMARGVREAWPDHALDGLVVTPHGSRSGPSSFEVVEAGHPIPDRFSETAARRALALAEELGAEDRLLTLISGGGSALLAAPAPGLTLADKRAATEVLLRSGAPVAAVNAVRKRLSAVKGGRLAAAAWPAGVTSLIISDVVGDAPELVASGPTAASGEADAEAWRDATPFVPLLSARVRTFLARPDERPGRTASSDLRVIARGADALDAAAREGERLGFAVISLGDRVQGEARAVARAHAAEARRRRAEAPGRPLLILSGGETTVTVRGQGRGGPNTEYLLALAIALEGEGGVYALAADTDGVDGRGPSAGALVGPDTLARAARLGLDPAARLADNDAQPVFEALGDLVTTGPTGTNVNDFRAIVVFPE
jgi:hydroxypyruvate reductase